MTSRVGVLLVEDDPSIREITELALSIDRDIVIRSCASGFEAIERLLDKERDFDLILLDMNLQDGTGLDVMRELRRHQILSQIPVVFFTAKALDRDIEIYKDAGAIGIITKPFDPIILPGIVREYVDQHRARKPTQT